MPTTLYPSAFTTIPFEERRAAQSRRVCGFALARRFVLDDVAGDGAGRHRQRTRQIHLPGTAAAGELPVLRADDHLVGEKRPGHGAGHHRQRTRQIHLPGTAAPGKIPVLRADDHLVGTRRNSRSGVDAGAATRLDHLCAGLAEDVEIALTHAVFARLLRSELEIELAALRHPLALP